MTQGSSILHYLGLGCGPVGIFGSEGCSVRDGALLRAGGGFGFAGDGCGCRCRAAISGFIGAHAGCGAGRVVIGPYVGCLAPCMAQSCHILHVFVLRVCPVLGKGCSIFGPPLFCAGRFICHDLTRLYRYSLRGVGLIVCTCAGYSTCAVVSGPGVGYFSGPGMVAAYIAICSAADFTFCLFSTGCGSTGVVLGGGSCHSFTDRTQNCGGTVAVVILGRVGNRAGYFATCIITGGITGVFPDVGLCFSGHSLTDRAEDRTGAVTIVSLGSVGDRAGHFTTIVVTGGVTVVIPGVGLCFGGHCFTDRAEDRGGAVAIISIGGMCDTCAADVAEVVLGVGIYVLACCGYGLGGTAYLITAAAIHNLVVATIRAAGCVYNVFLCGRLIGVFTSNPAFVG